MTEVEQRIATASDAIAIRNLTRAAYTKWIPLIGREPKPMTVDYEAALERHRFDLFVKNGEIVALIETVDQGDCLLIENLAVAPSFQKQGLGRRMIGQAEALAQSLRRPVVRLYTNQKFLENVRFYERLGYAIDREENISGLGVAVHMSKAVARGPG